ncbi:hypothetical protein HYW46_06520 [Candidatus Daviesbacteria bacterium]|nr:hypothetical protein [Candidatus Daviesbacteria bacterium]
MKTCKFCKEKVVKLANAHVLPRAYFEYSRRKAKMTKTQSMKLITNTKDQFPIGKVRIGWYDSDLVCAECENRFAPYDNYSPRLLLQNEDHHRQIIVNGDLKGWEIAQFDYEKLKLFVISVLWRAGASQLPQFGKINLSQEELERARQNILNNDSGGDNNFSFIIARFPDDIGQSFMADPHPEYDTDMFAGLNAYRFYIGAGYIVYIKVGTKLFPEPGRSFVVSKETPLRILTRDNFLQSKEADSMRKVMEDADKTLTEIKGVGGKKKQ